jgi:hypothetical protein
VFLEDRIHDPLISVRWTPVPDLFLHLHIGWQTLHPLRRQVLRQRPMAVWHALLLSDGRRGQGEGLRERGEEPGNAVGQALGCGALLPGKAELGA